MFEKLIAAQLRTPSGVLAELTAWSMNRMNREMTQFAIRNLKIQPHHTVLDIGFGGGISLSLIAAATSDVAIAGIEISQTMLSRARTRYAQLIKQGKLELAQGSVEQIPYPNEHFDRICTVNTVYFWSNPEAGVREVFRVLKPGGLFALCFRPRADMESLKFTRTGFNLYTSEDIALLLNHYTAVQITSARDQHLGYACAIACKN